MLAAVAKMRRETVSRWQTKRRLPPRDFFVNGEAIGWRPETVRPSLQPRALLN
jgi:hypothetical protein